MLTLSWKHSLCKHNLLDLRSLKFTEDIPVTGWIAVNKTNRQDEDLPRAQTEAKLFTEGPSQKFAEAQ